VSLFLLASLLLLACLQLLAFLMFSLLLASLVFSPVALIPAVADVHANDSVFAVASLPANPCVPMLLKLVSLRTVLYNETY
jgi:hypothetical protein